MTVTAVALLLISIGFIVYEIFTVQQRMRHDLTTKACWATWEHRL